MQGQILTCEVCGREGRAIPCKNVKYCQQGRCPICFVTILETPDVWKQVWSIQLTCESCCQYGSRCLFDDKDIPSLSSQAVGKALQQQSSSRRAAEKRPRPSADGQLQLSKRPKGSSAPVKPDVKPTPAQFSVKQEAPSPPPAAAAASKQAATQAEKQGTFGSGAQQPAAKQTPPSGSQQLGPGKKAAAVTATAVTAAAVATKDAGKQQPVYSKRPPEATAMTEEQRPVKRQASEQQINRNASDKGGSKAGDSGGAAASDKEGSKTGGSSGAAAAAAAAMLQAKVGASSGLQRPLSGGGLLSKSRTTGTVGTCSTHALPKVQEVVAAGGGGAGAGLRRASANQQQQAPGSGGLFAAAAKLWQSKPGQSRPGGSSVGPTSIEELGRVGSKQQAAGGVVKQPLEPLRPTTSNSQGQQRQHNAEKQQEFTPRSRVEAFPTVSPSPQKSALSPAKAAAEPVAQPANAQAKAPEQPAAYVQDTHRQQLEKLRKKKQQQLEKKEEQQQLVRTQHERQQPALEAKQKIKQPLHTIDSKKPSDGLAALSKVAGPASGKCDRAATAMGVATTRTASGKATNRPAGNGAGTHAASVKLSSGVDATAASGRLQLGRNASGTAASSGKQQDSLDAGRHAGIMQPGDGLQQRAAERRHAGLQLKQGPSPCPTLAERQQQRRQTAHAAHRVGFSLSSTVQNIGGLMGSAERGASEERADDGTIQAGAQAVPVAKEAPKRKSTSSVSCSLKVTSESMFWAVPDAKVDVLLGQLPPLLGQHQGSAKYSGSIAGRNVLDSFEGDEAGDMLAAPDFSRVTVILRERAFGGKKMLPSLIDTLVRGSKYVKVEHGGQKMYLAPVLKQREDDKELVDYVTFALCKHEDVWSRVYDDRLGVFSYLKPGEQPAAKLEEVERVVASAPARTPRSWDPQAPPERPALRQSNLGILGGGLASVSYVEPLPALQRPSPAQALHSSFMGDDDDLFGHHDHDEHVGVANAGFGVGMAHQTPTIAGFGVGMGSDGLGVGMSSGVLGHNVAMGLADGTGAQQTDAGVDFMEHDAYEDALEFDRCDNNMPAQQVKEYSPAMGLAQQQPQPIAQPRLDTMVVGGSTQGKDEKQTRTVRFADALGDTTLGCATQQQPSHTGPPLAALGSSGALEPQRSLEKQTSFPGNAITQIVQSQTPCKLLLPSLSGLCKHINEHGIKGLRVHVDTSLTQHAREKARELSAFLREQGAIVTETIPAPPARKVQVLLVSKQWVLTQGLEGGSSHLRLIEYLVAGTHVMTESFVEALKAGKLVLENLERERSHVQVFAEGVHLLWDATLLCGSTSAELAELVRAVEEASARLGAGQQNKQRFKAWVMSKDRGKAPEHFTHLNIWHDSKIVDTLPNAYISSSKEMVKTAAKAIHIMNKDAFPLRYMMVVVPDMDSSTAQQKLTEDDWRYISTLVLAANKHKTICAATRTQAIQFLNLLR